MMLSLLLLLLLLLYIVLVFLILPFPLPHSLVLLWFGCELFLFCSHFPTVCMLLYHISFGFSLFLFFSLFNIALCQWHARNWNDRKDTSARGLKMGLVYAGRLDVSHKMARKTERDRHWAQFIHSWMKQKWLCRQQD